MKFDDFFSILFFVTMAIVFLWWINWIIGLVVTGLLVLGSIGYVIWRYRDEW
ncbi:hypothetical protein [Saccharopolyspora pogona]|uniref:hypothetical protein n=1 Tax=Saccharopolyspora pogona TaxID=333966 RepID=UPI0016899681|nr:hypothetical protein [Saccharopolyspora pogona]